MRLFFVAKMGFEHSITSVRWTLVWCWLDSTNTLISATRKCNKSLLLRQKYPYPFWGMGIFIVDGGFEPI